MKKVLFVLAFVAVYGVSLAMTNATVVSVDETAIVVVDNNDNTEKEEGKKEAKADAKKSDGCGGEAKTEATKSSDCGGEAKAEGTKTAEANTSGSGCGGK